MPTNTQDHHPAAWLATLSAAAVLLGFLTLDHGDDPILTATALAALGLALLLIIPPFIVLKRHGNVRPGGSYMDTTTAVDRGPYAITRHPQYLGYMLLTTGFTLLTQHWLLALPAVLTWVGFAWQAIQEERDCREHLGRSYADYCQRVPRFNIVLGLLRWLQQQRRERAGNMDG
jgi:protein-S-isoprenylcysteine O-methyltransferase Ste14